MDFLVRRGKELRRLRRLVHRKRPNALWLSYESLTSRDGWSHVASFLDVELRESYVGTSRQSSGQPYDEVHNILAAKLLVGILQISGAQAVAQTQVGFLTLRAVRRIARAAGGRGAGEIVQ